MNFKLKKATVTAIITTILLAIFIAIPGKVNAGMTTVNKRFGITKIRMDIPAYTNDKGNTYHLGYSMGDGNQAGSQNSAIIWHIQEYQTGSDSLKADGSKNIYCVKAGVGFSNVGQKDTYTQKYDMKTDRSEITQKSELSALNQALENGYDGTRYDALLALADLMYQVSGSEDTTDARADFLLHANQNIRKESYGRTLLSEADIAAVQQAAIWYFTNYDEAKYKKRGNSDWLYYLCQELSPNKYQALKQFTGGESLETGIQDSVGSNKEEQVKLLYEYLIDTAEKNAKNYKNSASAASGAPVTLVTPQDDNLGFDDKTDSSNYILGPIRINKNADVSGNFSIELKVRKESKEGTEATGVKYLDSNKGVASSQNLADLLDQDIYISVPKTNGKKLNVDLNIKYSNSTISLYTSGETVQPLMIPEKEEQTDNHNFNINIQNFDLALRKMITAVNGVPVDKRLTSVDIEGLKDGSQTTADYGKRTDPIKVKTGDIVTYTLRIYNEGDLDGYASEITEDIPKGLEFLYSEKQNTELDNDPDLSSEEKAAIKKNQEYLWEKSKFEGDKVTEITTTYLSHEENPDKKIKAFNPNAEYSDTDPKNPDYQEVEVNMKVVAENKAGTIIRNEAAITKHQDEEGTPHEEKDWDRDSNPDEWPGRENGNYQDDEDWDNIQLEEFDLALRKFITKVEETAVEDRIPNPTLGEDGNIKYEHKKTPVEVATGNVVEYTIRIFNEGDINGYASRILDDIPEGLKYLPDNTTNQEFGWKMYKELTGVSVPEKDIIIQDGKQYIETDDPEEADVIATEYLSKEQGDARMAEEELDANPNLLKAFDAQKGITSTNPDYKDVKVAFEVIEPNSSSRVLVNSAQISDDTDENGKEVEDKDSEPGDWNEGEDDQDKEYVRLGYIDLALRKFIVAISKDENIENEEYLGEGPDGPFDREPQVDTSKLNTLDENGEVIKTAEYNHPKDALVVQRGDIVVYRIRVYNEGNQDAYASEIVDHLPPYLEFIDNDFNKAYGWIQEEDEEGRPIVRTRYLEDTKLDAAVKNEDGTYTLDQADVPIMCRVTDSAKRNEKITNIADITEYKDAENNVITEDRDSQPENVTMPEDLPGYKDDEGGSYIPGQQDDDDFEKVIIKKFDLALRKWVTQAIVTDKSGTTVTNTGHQPYDDPEQIVKVEINRKKLNEVTVKFRYSIRVVNEGDIAGYAKEITDYVPEGLKFVAEDNPNWKDEGNNVISTRQLEDVLLQPGEFRDIEVVLTWINNEENMGVKTNTAEISEDYNEYGVPDEDSEPDNKKPGEDDIDDAPVMLAVSTGEVRIYLTLGLVILITLAAGIVTIRKYTL